MSVCNQDVVTSCPQHYTLSQPSTCLHVPVPPELTVVVEEVRQPDLHQQVSNLLAARVLGFDYVDDEVPYFYGSLVTEVFQGFLQVWLVLQGCGREGKVVGGRYAPMVGSVFRWQ